MLRIVVAMAVLSLALPVRGAAQERDAGVPVIAVVQFHGVSLDRGDDAAAIGGGLADLITAELATRPGIRGEWHG